LRRAADKPRQRWLSLGGGVSRAQHAGVAAADATLESDKNRAQNSFPSLPNT
jgi:hypothetical protein